MDFIDMTDDCKFKSLFLSLSPLCVHMCMCSHGAHGGQLVYNIFCRKF